MKNNLNLKLIEIALDNINIIGNFYNELTLVYLNINEILKNMYNDCISYINLISINDKETSLINYNYNLKMYKSFTNQLINDIYVLKLVDINAEIKKNFFYIIKHGNGSDYVYYDNEVYDYYLELLDENTNQNANTSNSTILNNIRLLLGAIQCYINNINNYKDILCTKKSIYIQKLHNNKKEEIKENNKQNNKQKKTHSHKKHNNNNNNNNNKYEIYDDLSSSVTITNSNSYTISNSINSTNISNSPSSPSLSNKSNSSYSLNITDESNILSVTESTTNKKKKIRKITKKSTSTITNILNYIKKIFNKNRKKVYVLNYSYSYTYCSIFLLIVYLIIKIYKKNLFLKKIFI